MQTSVIQSRQRAIRSNVSLSSQVAENSDNFFRQKRTTSNFPSSSTTTTWRRYRDANGVLKLEVTRTRTQSRVRVTSVFSQAEKTLTEVETVNAIIDFSTIATACTVHEENNDDRQPWEDDEYYDHELQTPSDFKHSNKLFKQTRGYVRTINGRIVMPNREAFLEEQYDELRHRYGCSKQVAREGAATILRNWFKQLVDWHRGCYSYHTLVIECIAAGYTYREMLGGILDYEDLDKHEQQLLREELAAELAYQLENDGFIIVNKPEYTASKHCRNRYNHQQSVIATINRRG